MGTAISKRKALAKRLILEIMDDLQERRESEIYAAVSDTEGIGPKAVRAGLTALQSEGKVAYDLVLGAWYRTLEHTEAKVPRKEALTQAAMKPDSALNGTIFEPYFDGGIRVQADLYIPRARLEAMGQQRLSQIISAAHVLLTAQADLADEPASA